jgi:signal transduction histidine kinase
VKKLNWLGRMSTRDIHPVKGYAAALAVVAFNVALFWVAPSLQVAAAALIGVCGVLLLIFAGLGPSVVATGTGLFLVHYIFLKPQLGEPLLFRGLIVSIMLLLAFYFRKAYRLTELQRVKLEEALRMRDDFLSIAGHELKTPLTALLLSCRKMEKLCTCEAGQKPLATMGRQITRLSELVNVLMDVSKISSGRMEYSMEVMDVCEVVKDVMDRMSPTFSDNGCHVSLNCNLEEIITIADRTRMSQAVTNLLSNACKYAGRTLIEIGLDSDAGYVKLTVKDHGPGIQSEKLERIFERYERAVSDKQKYISGLGLGLWITREIVKAHGGEIWAKSVVGEGSTFTMVIPRRQW